MPGDAVENFLDFQLGGAVIRIQAGLPFQPDTYGPAVRRFLAPAAAQPDILYNLHFSMPEIDFSALGREVYRAMPYSIYHGPRGWAMFEVGHPGDDRIYEAAFFNEDFSRGDCYYPDDREFLAGNNTSITLLTTDQLFIAPYMAQRGGCLFHSAGMIFEGQGLLFAGHSEAGKSTMVKMMRDEAQILCDDRMIIRDMPGGFRIYGTWSHGEIDEVNPGDVPLAGIFFLEKAEHNRVVPFDTPLAVVQRMPMLMVRALGTRDFWNDTLALIEKIVRTVPCYRLQFDRSGQVKETLREFLRG